MLVVFINILICSALIFLVFKHTEKKEHQRLKRFWWSAAVTGLVTTVVETVYNERFGGSAGLLTMDIENAVFLIIIAASVIIFAVCSIIAGIIYFDKMKPVYLQMLFALFLALGHNGLYRHISKATPRNRPLKQGTPQNRYASPRSCSQGALYQASKFFLSAR